MSEEIFDVPEFKERVQDDNELMLELLEIFTTDFISKREQLQAAIEGNDAEALRSVAHSLKGASGNISAKAIRVYFIELEDSSKEAVPANAGEFLPKIDEAFEALKVKIEEFKSQIS